MRLTQPWIATMLALSSIVSVLDPRCSSGLVQGFVFKGELGVVFAQKKDWDRNGSPRQCAADLLALFGGETAASAVEQSRAKELLECVHLLFSPSKHNSQFFNRSANRLMRDDEEQEMVCGNWNIPVHHGDFGSMISSPPEAVEELARKAVEWGGDPTVILDALGPATYPVPEVEGSSEKCCTLTKYGTGRRFANTDITKYMAFLFEAIAKLSPSVGLNISLNRFDLFHGHMFTAYNTGRLGILFHSREYPAYDDDRFPLNLGFCQTGSTVPFDASMALRNIVWLAPMPLCNSPPNSSIETCSKKWLAPGALFVLNTGGRKILERELVPEYLDIVHTISEDDLGEAVIDVNYFKYLETIENCVYLC